MSAISLDDKYLATTGRVYVTGSQALVRLPLDQARRDAAAGLNTAGFISGYRGSPLGIYDMALWQADRHLKANRIHFQPGVNEDLAATAVWGSQQVPLLQKPRYEGVFALWYGKGPGVDRSADVLKHGSYAGSHPKGGVLVLCGDDHAARSSTLAHQSDHAMIHCGMPLLHPADIQEYLDFGLFGLALSRYSGCWVGFKCVTDTVDGSASVLVDPARINPVVPTDFVVPADGLGIRFEIAMLKTEARLFEQRHSAAQAFVRANGLDQIRLGAAGQRRRLGIVTTGKSYLDVMEALSRLGIDQRDAATLGVGVYKVAMVYPIEPENIKAFAQDCDELLVIEEKRGVIEEQLAHVLFNVPAARRPLLIGKRDESGRPFVSEVGEFGPEQIMRYIADRYLRRNDSADIRKRFAAHVEGDTAPAKISNVIRMPAFCAGCPHNTSTRVPEGSVALAGIGCHGMAAFMPDRKIVAAYHMGGEGAPWIGQAPFVETPHVFQNIGDGTYFHSGILAVRACVAANVNITYKILVNGAVGMTGGQQIEGEQFAGEVTAPHVAQQVHAEGVHRIAVVTDDVEKYGDRAGFPSITTFHHRDQLDDVQREIRDWKGVSALIYDQSCATERRRLRKRGKVADTNVRLYIQPEVCEGCGDCGVQSNCIAIEPLETEFGRKRQIDQSVCNKDYSCIKGFCPSFVTVTGGKPRARRGQAGDLAERVAALPEPAIPAIDNVFSVLVAGIGGNGVVTIGALLGMAAHLEHKSCTVLDMSGFAQRNGSVMSHVRLAAGDHQEHPARIASHSADVVIGCDPVVAASADAIRMMAPQRTTVVINRFVAPTSAFAVNPDFSVDYRSLEQVIAERVGADQLFGIEATKIAMALLGDAIGANLFLVGIAWQKGLIPLQRASIEAAIETNGTAKEMNLKAFALGRLVAAQPDALIALLGKSNKAKPVAELALPELVASRVAHLTAYQDARLANRYRALVDRVDAAERALGRTGLAAAVAHVYAKLLSYKDEYEVARLFTAPAFREQLEQAFEGDLKIAFNLGSPLLLARRDAKTGRLNKRQIGPWILPVFKVLAALKVLRGTPFDIIGYGAHRRLERALIREYEAVIDRLLRDLTSDNHADAVVVAKLYDSARGYDIIKEANIEKLRKSKEEALARFEANKQKPLPATAQRSVA
jgi:indolepyruvate ferredoxin oxidoreductase